MNRSLSSIGCRFAVPLLFCFPTYASEFFTLDNIPAIKQLSGDGSTVLLHDRLWVPQTGGITVLPQGMIGNGITSDGSMVVGILDNDGQPEAVRWSVDGETTSIGRFPPDLGALGVSSDGSAVVGWYDTDPFVWTESSGLRPIDITILDPVQGSSADLVSDGGDIVVGELQGNGEIPSRSFRWTKASGVSSLGEIPGKPNVRSRDMSPDGGTIVGWASVTGDARETSEAWRWTEETGMEGLGVLPGRERSFALAVSPDGSLIVGLSRDQPDDRELFAWTEDTGMVSLTEILMDEVGVELRGSAAYLDDMSDDLHTLVGHYREVGGIRAWAIELDQPLGDLVAATVPEPASVSLMVIGILGGFILQQQRVSNRRSVSFDVQ